MATEVTVNGKAIDTAEARCGTTESCPITRQLRIEEPPGTYTLVVKATDGYGQWTSKTRTFKVESDTTKPTLDVGGELADAPEGWVQQESYGFDATASDPNGYGVTSLALRIDGNTVASASPQTCPEGACTDSLHTPVDMGPYAGGEHDAEVVAVDGGGNSATKSWEINVDPQGHVSAVEATETMEAAEDTGVPSVVGSSESEPGIEGSDPGLGLERTETGFQSTGTIVGSILPDEAGGPITIYVPTSEEIYSCGGEEGSSQAEVPPAERIESEGTCEGETEGEFVPVEVTPVSVAGGASTPILVEENATVAANSGSSVDTIARPLDDGGMIFQAIRDTTASESYAYEVSLGEEQYLEQVDAHHVEVYYSGHEPAFTISAEPAHDAVGTTVPTSLTITGHKLVTLHVEYRSAGGTNFVLPVVAGTGWEGGFTTTEVIMENPTPPPVEDSGGGSDESGLEEEGFEAEAIPSGAVLLSKVSGSPPVFDGQGPSAKKFHRNFKVTKCMHKKGAFLNPGEYVEALPPVPVGEDERYQEIHNFGAECENPNVGEGVYWAVALHGVYHYELEKWIWVWPAQWACNRIWGPEPPRMVGCYDGTPSEPYNTSAGWLKWAGPLHLIGEYFFFSQQGHWGTDAFQCMEWMAELKPHAPTDPGSPYRPRGRVHLLGYNTEPSSCPNERYG